VSKNLLLSDAAIGSVSQHAKALQIEPSLKVPTQALLDLLGLKSLLLL